MSNKNKTETNRIQQVAKDSRYAKGIAPETILYSGEIFCRFIKKIALFSSSALQREP